MNMMAWCYWIVCELSIHTVDWSWIPQFTEWTYYLYITSYNTFEVVSNYSSLDMNSVICMDNGGHTLLHGPWGAMTVTCVVCNTNSVLGGHWEIRFWGESVLLSLWGLIARLCWRACLPTAHTPYRVDLSRFKWGSLLVGGRSAPLIPPGMRPGLSCGCWTGRNLNSSSFSVLVGTADWN